VALRDRTGRAEKQNSSFATFQPNGITVIGFSLQVLKTRTENPVSSKVRQGKGERAFVQRLVVITPLRSSGMERILKGSHLHTPRSSANEINHTLLCLPNRPRRDERLNWPWVAG